MTDENFDELFDNNDGVGESSNDGGTNAPVDGVRSVQDFHELVAYHIAVMTSAKNSTKVRVESALWLGESGEIDAIRPLIAVYKRDKKNPKVQKAAGYALGMFKALDAAISRQTGEMIEDALERPENADIMQTLTDIAIFDRRGSRKGGRRLLRMMFVLLAVLTALFVAYTLMPKGSLRQALTPPTPTPTPTIDPNAPTPTPTFTPSLTPTITPTPTVTPGIPPEEVRVIQGDLLTLIGRATTTRDFLDSLTTIWTTLAQNATNTSINSVCSIVTPPIPDDYVLPPGYGALNPTLGQATDYINSGLSVTRNGWSYFRESCAQGTMTQERIQTGLSAIRNAQDLFNAANTILTDQ